VFRVDVFGKDHGQDEIDHLVREARHKIIYLLKVLTHLVMVFATHTPIFTTAFLSFETPCDIHCACQVSQIMFAKLNLAMLVHLTSVSQSPTAVLNRLALRKPPAKACKILLPPGR
jgi:hypothetical protein